jgi:hypothetical protein
MNTMHREVQQESPVLLRQQVIEVEKESMEPVLEQRPDETAQRPARSGQRDSGRGGR